MIKVVIIGSGNLAIHLYHCFSLHKEIEIIQIFSRDPGSLNFVKQQQQKVHDLKEIKEADVYLLAVKDEAIPEVASKLPYRNGVFAHTSGSVSVNALERFENHGVFYPLQSFSKAREVNFRDVPICLEANTEKNFSLLENLANQISDSVFEVNSEKRRALHLSAVFVNNFSNHMYALAEDFCRKNELPFRILIPLLKETAAKVETLSPFSAQTGPALRYDQKTIQAHLELLDEETQELYTTITQSIQKLHGKKL